MIKINNRHSILAATMLTLAGCGSSSDNLNTGSLSLAITDGAIDSAQNVFVQISGVEIHSNSQGAQQFDFDAPRSIDLLSLQGSASTALLDGVALEAGSYQWMRLKVVTEGDLDTYIVLDDGSSYELDIPSGSETGLKVNRGFDLAVNTSANFTIDFDLRKSITVQGLKQGNPQFKLRPTLRVTDNSEVGHVQGTVDGTLITNSCGDNNNYAVYIYEGLDVNPDDEGSATSPLTTSLLDDQYQYEIGFVNSGDYTLAFTCMADGDDPELDDDAFGNETADGFVQTANVSVESKKVTTFNFE